MQRWGRCFSSICSMDPASSSSAAATICASHSSFTFAHLSPTLSLWIICIISNDCYLLSNLSVQDAGGLAHLILRRICCWLPCISHLHLSSASLLLLLWFCITSKLSHSADAKLFPPWKLWSHFQQINKKFTRWNLVLLLNNSQSDSQDKKFNKLPYNFSRIVMFYNVVHI